MSSTSKTFGRAVQITTLVLLVLVAGYLLINHDKEPPPILGSAVQIRQCDVADLYVPDQQAIKTTPSDVVEQAISGIQATLRSSEYVYQENSDESYDLFSENLLPYLDRPHINSVVLAAHWETATVNQRARFDCAFQIILIEKLATDLFECFQGEMSVLPNKGNATNRTTLVHSRCVLVDDSAISVQYALAYRSDHWRIVDVLVESLPYVRTFRAELKSEILLSGLDKVIQRLEDDAKIVPDAT